VTPFTWVSDPSELAAKKSEIAALGFPLFVKPSRQGSSVGVSKVTSSEALEKAVHFAFRFDSKVLIERGITGRELECSVLGLNASPRASVPGEIRPSEKVGWYSYEAKYLMDDGAETIVPASLPPARAKEIQDLACQIFRLLECDGMARIDLFLEKDTDKLFFNEANTLPGFTPISMYPKMWEASGLSYSELIGALIDLAFAKRKSYP
jgi:D-alanine-D-alanine ligase